MARDNGRLGAFRSDNVETKNRQFNPEAHRDIETVEMGADKPSSSPPSDITSNTQAPMKTAPSTDSGPKSSPGWVPEASKQGRLSRTFHFPPPNNSMQVLAYGLYGFAAVGFVVIVGDGLCCTGRFLMDFIEDLAR